MNARSQLEALFREAVAAVHSGPAVERALVRDGAGLRIGGRPVPDDARLVILAAGKAAAPMAAAAARIARGRIAAGLAITKQGHGVSGAGIPLREAAHPVPDARAERAAREALALVESASPDDVLLVLLSGGASAVTSCPAPGLSLADLASVTALLLEAGAEIDELNAVRKHLSAFAGGRLARRAASRRIEVLALSDVPGDRLDVIGSGPCAADPTTYAEAVEILERRQLRDRAPARVVAHLEAGARGDLEETPKPGDPALERVRSTILASNEMALRAVHAAALERGLTPVGLGTCLRGEARVVGRRFAALARAVRSPRPVCLIAGGETTVTVRGGGRGGRSQEFALAAALELAGSPRVAILAAGTDGSDGPTDAAGAYADCGTVERGLQRGQDARLALDQNDTYNFFAAESGLLHTGPTATNVMDLAIALVQPSAA